jgi:hypothetical protein
MSDSRNGFERHELRHNSASQENTWINAPDGWLAQKVLNHTWGGSADMQRGNAVEAVIADVLCAEEFTAALERALRRFDGETAFSTDDPSDQRALTKPMAEHAINAITGWKSALEMQSKIMLQMSGNGWSLPIVGFSDMCWESEGVIVDIKSTTRLPTCQSREHQRQRAIYVTASGNKTVLFLYVSAKGWVWGEDGDPTEPMAETLASMNRRERFLAAGDREGKRNCTERNA